MPEVTAVLDPSELLYDISRGVHYERPLLRGWMHLVCFEAALVVGTLLIVTAHGARETAIAAVYAATVAGMFGASALYHRGRWGPRARAALQRLDHMMIFLVIAGTSSAPLAVCLPSPYSWIALAAMWLLTAVAAAARHARMHLPEWLAGAVFIGLGWAAGAAVPAVWVHSGVGPAVLLIVGGLLYTLGALSFHRRWPDPAPAVFGYHEVFHLFVSVAAACQYVAIACFLL
ncbi:MAG TPA: hemolysin III family protein [Mycobacteriales bacterium]|nr:hemolysin III family protein [Mycobacteriales bacterium]